MDFGIFNLTQQRDRATSSKEIVETALEETVHAERLGFARAWFVEHHFSNYSICGSPLLLAAHAAARTSTIRLGSAVVIAPLHAPARLLTEIAMVDTLSDGRLDLGLGSGYQRFEFERFGVDIAENKARFHEMLDLIERGLAQPSFSYEGEHYRVPPTAISIRPLQTPHPPIWIAGHDPVAHRRCARSGYTPFLAARFAGGKNLMPMRETLEASWRAEGKDPETMPLGLLSFCHVTDSKADARHYADCARYQHRLSTALRFRRETVVEDYWVEEAPFEDEPPLEDLEAAIPVGDVETVAERVLAQIRLLRPRHIAFYFQVGDMERRKVMRAMERFMGEVVPLLERAHGRPLAEINAPHPAAAAE